MRARIVDSKVYLGVLENDGDKKLTLKEKK